MDKNGNKNVFDKIGDLANKAIGDDGVKTEIKVEISDKSIMKAGAMIFLSFVGIIIVWFAIKAISSKSGK